jgi:hypothetical protein
LIDYLFNYKLANFRGGSRAKIFFK